MRPHSPSTACTHSRSGPNLAKVLADDKVPNFSDFPDFGLFFGKKLKKNYEAPRGQTSNYEERRRLQCLF